MVKGIHKVGEEEIKKVMVDEVMVMQEEEQCKHARRLLVRMIGPDFFWPGGGVGQRLRHLM